METVAVLGAGGFVAGHYVGHLLDAGYSVRGFDIKPFEYWFQRHEESRNREKIDLSIMSNAEKAVEGAALVVNCAAYMGGMGVIATETVATGRNVLISTNVIEAAYREGVERYLYTGSACCYPNYRQLNSSSSALSESDAWPAEPQEMYGIEKLFSEELARRYHEKYGFEVRLPRLHNCYGPKGSYRDGKEKAPSAICRKVVEAKLSGSNTIEIWGDGEQARSFMYVEDCMRGFDLLLEGNYAEPVNLGSAEMVTINQLVTLVEEIAGVTLSRTYKLDAPQGVRGRNSDNTLMKRLFDWEPAITLREGLEQTYAWILEEMS